MSSYPSLGDQILNAIAISVVLSCGGVVVGAFWMMFIRIFLSLGMLMIFLAWLQFIDFDGSWPADQPIEREFYQRRTRADEQRIWTQVGDNMTDSDWKDYHRCRDVNVCVRRFTGMRRP